MSSLCADHGPCRTGDVDEAKHGLSPLGLLFSTNVVFSSFLNQDNSFMRAEEIEQWKMFSSKHNRIIGPTHQG